MNRNRTKIAGYAMTGILAAGLTVLAPSMPAYAATLSDSLPSAGFSIAVDEGTSVKDVKEEVKGIVATPSAGTTPAEEKENKDNKEKQSEEAATEEANKATVEKTIDFDKEVVEAVVRTPGDMIADDAREDFSNLVIAKVTNYVNVRDLPDENEGKIVGKLYDKSVGEFIEEKDGWYKIESGSCTGWVKGEFCVTGDDAVELA
ncbi:MAG: SH3 domain-containing protein, partial [Lachnospiraceae bacterium]|nr:SH3 domain-containing protein [Lachnospiraceae bacterium]